MFQRLQHRTKTATNPPPRVDSGPQAPPPSNATQTGSAHIPGRNIVPPPPGGGFVPSPQVPNAPIYASPADIAAKSGDMRQAQQGYLQNAAQNPLDPIPIMQLMRLAAGNNHNPAGDLASLRQKLAEREPRPVPRAIRWLRLYRPVEDSVGQLWVEPDLTKLTALARWDALNPVQLQEVLDTPPPKQTSWLEYTIACRRTPDLEEVLRLGRLAQSDFQPDQLLASLQLAIKHKQAAACALLVSEPALSLTNLPADDRNKLLTMAATSRSQELQVALAKRSVHVPGAVDIALKHHSLERVAILLRLAKPWEQANAGNPVHVALKRPVDRIQALQLLLRHGLPLNRSTGGSSGLPLLQAVLANDLDAVKLFLEAGAILTPEVFAAASTNRSPLCLHYLRYKDEFNGVLKRLATRLDHADSASLKFLDIQLREIDMINFSPCMEFIETLLCGHHIGNAQVCSIVASVQRIQYSVATPPGRAALGWISAFTAQVTRQDAFTPLSRNPAPSWPKIIDSIEAIFAFSSEAQRDTKFLANRSTIEAIMNSRSAEAWPMDVLLDCMDKGMCDDTEQARLYKACVKIIAAGMDRTLWEKDLTGTPQTILAFLENKANSKLSRLLDGLTDGVASVRDGLLRRFESTPLSPSAPNEPFFYYEPKRNDRKITRELLAFLTHWKNHPIPLINSGSEEGSATQPNAGRSNDDEICRQAATLVADAEVIEDTAENCGACAYLQLLQAIVGPERMLELFTDGSSSIQTKPIIKLQLRFHPDKNPNFAELSRCLNTLKDLFRSNAALVQNLCQAFTATQTKRAKFYGMGVQSYAPHMQK